MTQLRKDNIGDLHVDLYFIFNLPVLCPPLFCVADHLKAADVVGGSGQQEACLHRPAHI